MADETEEARKKEIEYLEQQLKGIAANTKQYETLNGILEKVKKQTVDYSSRLLDLSKASKEEKDASKIRLQMIKDEREALNDRTKTEASNEAAKAIREAKNLSQLEGAQRELLAKEYEQVRALETTEKRQKVFNDSLASTKSYLLPLGQAAGDVAKSLASSISANPLEASAAMATKYAEKAGQGLNAAGTAAGGLGQSLTQSTKGPVKALGVGLQGLGLAAGAAGTAANIAAQAISTIAPIISGFQKTYTEAAAAGAVFGGGMTELRNIAGETGMKMADLTSGVSKGSEAFLNGGLNFSQATQAVRTMKNRLVEGSAASELFALGFTDISDRVALTGPAFERARQAGMSQADATQNLTSLTVQYGKDLKVMQGVVGKNAEAEMRKAQVASMGASIASRLNDDQQKVFKDTFTTMAKFGPEGDKLRLAMQQILTSGSTTIAEYAQDPVIMDSLRGVVANIKEGGEDGASANLKILADMAQQQRDGAGRYQAVNDAVIMGVDGIAKAMSESRNNIAATFIDGKAIDDQKKNVKTLTENTDETTTAMSKITESANLAQAALEQLATDPKGISLFATAMGKANEATQSLIDMIKSATSGTSGSIMESGAKGVMDVISSPDTWMTAAGVIGAEIASKMGTSLLSRFPALSGILGAGATAAGSAIGAGAAATGAGVAGTTAATAATAATTAATAGAAGAAAMTGAAVAGVAIAAAGAIVGSAALADYIEEKSGLKEAYQKRMATEEYKNMSQDQAGLAAGVGARLSGRSKATGNPADIAAERTAYINDRQSKKIPTSMTFDEWKANKDKAPSIATPVNPGASITPTPTAESVFGPEGLQPLNQQQRAAAGVDESGNRVVSTTADAGKEQLDATRKQIALWEDIHDTLLDLVRYSRTTAEAIQ